MGRFLVFGALISLVGCAQVKEASRPEPVDLSKFSVGESRMDIVSSLGSPMATIQDKADSCDVYKLHTSGPAGVGQDAIAATKVVANVLTSGLAEALFVPLEAGMAASRQTVMFCYSDVGKLVSLKESDVKAGG